MLQSPTKTHPPPSNPSPVRPSSALPLSAGAGFVPAHPTDEEMFKRRYIAIQDIIHELEDENNLIAYRIAKLKRQRREALEQEAARARAEAEAEAEAEEAERIARKERVKREREIEEEGQEREVREDREVGEEDMNQDGDREGEPEEVVDPADHNATLLSPRQSGRSPLPPHEALPSHPDPEQAAGDVGEGVGEGEGSQVEEGDISMDDDY